jgi:hypothetical protein
MMMRLPGIAPLLAVLVALGIGLPAGAAFAAESGDDAPAGAPPEPFLLGPPDQTGPVVVQARLIVPLIYFGILLALTAVTFVFF